MKSTEELDDLISALHSIDSNIGHKDWVAVLTSFKRNGGSREVAQSWSSQGASFDRVAFNDTWRSITLEGQIGAGTLYWHAKQAGWQPSKKFASGPMAPTVTSNEAGEPSRSYDAAKTIWSTADRDDDCVARHPYARRKRVSHAFGAARGVASGRLIGMKADCLIVPMRDFQGNPRGIECINSEGKKQTFGQKGYLLLGTPEVAEEIHIVEGWATAFAAFQLFKPPHAAIVAFGKGGLEKCGSLARARFRGCIRIHEEVGNVDLWDRWSGGGS